jgi:hypothetical protein
MNLHDLLPIFIPFATSAISLTITKSHLFSGFREWIGDRSDLLLELFSCPWCFSHWISAGIFLFAGMRLPLFWLIILIFANVSLSGMITNYTLRLVDDE